MGLLTAADYLTDQEKELLTETLQFATKAHEGQFRDTGEAFIMHPIKVAMMLTEYKPDLLTLQAALLHDVVEDTHVSIHEIKDKFCAKVSFIVHALTKGKKPETMNRLEFMESYYTQILLASEQDQRVALIKIFDRLHNIQTLHGKPAPKQVNYANETLTFFAPLAKKMGLRKVLLSLEEQSFFYLNKQRYEKTKLLVNQYKKQLESVVEKLTLTFKENKYEIFPDQTPLYSLYSSLQFDGELENEIFIRVHTASLSECYTALGSIHSIWPPITEAFTDNMNQLATPFDEYIETKIEIDQTLKCTVKIMTKQQGRAFDNGVLSKKIEGCTIPPIFWDSTTMDSLDHEAVIHEYFQPTIKVYNQYGDVVLVPDGSTVVDYLFYVYGEKAFYATGVTVNEKNSRIRDYLKAGDRIHCQIGGKITSSSDWINFATTRKAFMYLEKQRL